MLSLSAVIIFAVFLIFLGSTEYNISPRYELVQLEKGWTVSRGASFWTTDEISSFSVGVSNYADTIILENDLSKIEADPATVSFRTILSSVKVYLGGEEIYTFGEEFLSTGHMIPKVQHFVELPQDYAGKRLTIEITSWENDAYSGFSPVYFGSYDDIWNYLVENDRLSMVMGVFMLVFGCLLIILSPFVFLNKHNDISIVFGGFFSLYMGTYIICYKDIFWMFSSLPEVYTFLEYFTLFALPGCVVGFIATASRSRFRRIGFFLLIVNFAFSLITALLHLTNAVHICHFVSMLHLLALMEGTYLIIAMIHHIISTKKSRKESGFANTSANMLLAGLLTMLGCAIFEIVKFNILKYSRIGEVNANINFLTLGAFAFVLCLLLNYFYHCVEYISESTVKEHLVGLAYSDTLTGLSNRAKCEQVLTSLSGKYTIVSLDLDYLKYTNDNFGHAAGDKLLSEFAEILKNSFTDASLLGRMGGDEFIAVLPYVDDERTNRDLNCLIDQMEYKNSTETKLKFSASWGYAGSTDKDLKHGASAQSVYLLADKHMYTMKNYHHNQSLGRLYDDLLGKLAEKGGDSND